MPISLALVPLALTGVGGIFPSFQEPARPPVPPQIPAGPPLVPGESQEMRERVALAGAPAADERILTAVPAASVVVVTSASFDELRALRQENDWVRFFVDEIAAPVVDGAAGTPGMMMMHHGLPEWLDPVGLCASIHGRVAGFMSPGTAGGEAMTGTHPAFVGGLIVDPGQPDADFFVHVDALRAALDAEGQLSFEEHGGVEIGVAPINGEDFVALFECKGMAVLLISDDPAALSAESAACIDRLQGSAQNRGFLDAPLRRAVSGPAEKRSGAKTLEAFVGVQQILDLAATEGNMSEQDHLVMELLGLDAMRWIHSSLDIGVGEQLELATRVHLPGGLLGELADFFGRPSRELLRLMPRDALAVSLMNYDVWGAYKHVEAFLSANLPEAHREMQDGIDQLSTLSGVDLEEDLLSQLRGSVGTFTMELSPEEAFGQFDIGPFGTQSALAQGGVYLIELEDPAPVEEVVGRLLEIAGMGHLVETEDFGDYPVQVLDLDFMRFNWAFTDDMLVVSNYATPLHTVLDQLGREDAPSAADNERFVRVVERLDSASCVSVTDSATVGEQFLGMLGFMKGFGSMFLPPEIRKSVWLPNLSKIDWAEPAVAFDYFQGTLASLVERKGEIFSIVLEAR